MKKILWILVLGLLWCNASFAETIPEKRKKYYHNNLSHDFISCQAFYFYAAEAVKTNDPSSKLINNFQESAEVAGQIGFVFGSQAGLSDAALSARFKLEVKNMGNQIDNNFANISILIYQYGDFCKEIMNDSRDRENYWKEKSKIKFK